MDELRRGLYLVTATGLAVAKVIEGVRIALENGAVLVQYRDKSSDHSRRKYTAERLLGICRQWEVPLLINDDVQLALEIGADGVHIGGEDMPLKKARKLLGRERIIGVSCYNQLDLARQYAQEGADYLAFGRFFPSSTKPHAVRAGHDLLLQASEELTHPIVAIGGIDADNGGELVAAGADMLAVVGAVYGSENPAESCRSISDLFGTSTG